MINKLAIKCGGFCCSTMYVIYVIAAILLLEGCDGGIFGTGDGEVIEVNAPVANPAPQAPGVDTGIAPDAIDFDNNSSVTGRTDALLRFVQANSAQQDNIVATLNGNNNQLLLPLPGLSFLDGAYQYSAVSASQNHHLRFFLSEDFRAGNAIPIAVVNPLSVAPGSATTLILRGSGGAAATPIEILPAVTMVASAGTLSNIRVVHAASSFSFNGLLSIYFVEPGDTIENNIATISSLSYTSAAVSEYIDISPGQYDVVITRENDNKTLFRGLVPVTLVSQQVLTLVIRDDSAQEIGLLAVQDSAIPNE